MGLEAWLAPGVRSAAHLPLPPTHSGPQFWVFQDRQLEGAARPLTELGLPAGEEVDAVFSWPLNGKTYLIRGRRYTTRPQRARTPATRAT